MVYTMPKYNSVHSDVENEKRSHLTRPSNIGFTARKGQGWTRSFSPTSYIEMNNTSREFVRPRQYRTDSPPRRTTEIRFDYSTPEYAKSGRQLSASRRQQRVLCRPEKKDKNAMYDQNGTANIGVKITDLKPCNAESESVFAVGETKARKFDPRSKSNPPKALKFSADKDESDTDSVICRKTYFDRLITTCDFRYYNINDETYSKKPEEKPDDDPADTEPWTFGREYIPVKGNPVNDVVDEFKIQFRSDKIPVSQILPGRVYLRLKKELTIGSIVFKVDYVKVFCDREGKQTSEHERIFIKHTGNSVELDNPKVAPSNIDVLRKSKGQQKNKTGENKMYFDLFVPKSRIPTFKYFGTSGESLISSYSVSAILNIEENAIETEAMEIQVPSYGVESKPVVTSESGVWQLGLEKKYVAVNDAVNFVIGDEKGKEKAIKYELIRTVNSDRLGVKEDKIVIISGDNKDPVKECAILQRLADAGSPLTAKCSNYFDVKLAIPKNLSPSFSVEGFTCDYKLAVEIRKNQKYEVDVIICSEIIPERFDNMHISIQAKESTAWKKTGK